ncbi:A1 cistron-splicing factor [Pilobolus umbonatus]|nr:A1 cistron-splicing factor [Pilobolus umbonatus]
MNQDLANKLFDIGGFLLFLNAPPKLEFGIDYNAWTIGPLFKGVKLIPPGLHFIYFSSVSKEGVQGIRTGFFHFFESQEVVVREWDSTIEDIREETDPDQIERYRINMREFDRHLGPYPLDPPMYYERWKKLTDYITPGLVRRILPMNGKVSHLPDKSPNLSTDNEPTAQDKRMGRVIEKEEGMEFTSFDIRKSFPHGASATDITRWSLDKSWLLSDLLAKIYHNDYKALLGEMQLSFVCLLMAQNFSGFNQWKQLVQLLCSCSELMMEKPAMFVEFMDILQFQLEECPEDFFRDILSENNFTSVMLKSLQQNIPGSDHKLVSRYIKLKNFISKRFDWDIPEDEEDEDAPIIVDMD